MTNGDEIRFFRSLLNGYAGRMKKSQKNRYARMGVKKRVGLKLIASLVA